METTLSIEHEVLDFLKKELYLANSNGEICIYYAVNIKDIIKFIENPEKCGSWPFIFVCDVIESINKIKENYIVPYPKIEKQTEEDRILGKLLTKNDFFCFGTNTFFNGKVKVEHVILYMQRDKKIENWNAYFLCNVQNEVERVKKFLL